MGRFILCFLALFACSTTVMAKDFSGHYYLQDSTDVGSELILAKDGRFEWTLAYGVMNKYSEGKWHFQGNKLILNFVEIDTNLRAKLLNGVPDPISMNSPFDNLELIVKGTDLISKDMSGKYVKGKK